MSTVGEVVDDIADSSPTDVTLGWGFDKETSADEKTTTKIPLSCEIAGIVKKLILESCV